MCIFRMIIVQHIQYVCVIMETRMALVILAQEMALWWPVMTSWGRWWPQVGLCQLFGFGWEWDPGYVLYRSTSSNVGRMIIQICLHVSNEGELVTLCEIFHFFATNLQNCTIMVNSGPVVIKPNNCVMTYRFFGGIYLLFHPLPCPADRLVWER